MACSILIPTHNRPTVLCEAVLSALAGCPEDGEVLVVDDRSVPPAANALAEMTDKRLRIISSERPPGASGTRNTGIRRASHDVILFLDDDDLMIATIQDGLYGTRRRIARCLMALPTTGVLI